MIGSSTERLNHGETMKTEKEQETMEKELKRLEAQVEVERAAYRRLFTAVSDLVGNTKGNCVYAAMKRFKDELKLQADVIKILGEDLVKRKIGGVKLGAAVNAFIEEFRKRLGEEGEDGRDSTP